MNFYSCFILTTIAIFSFSTLIFANNDLDQLIDNSDITWAAEVYTDYVPNVNSYLFGRKAMKARYGMSKNSYDILKIQNEINDNSLSSSPSLLAYKLLQLNSNNFNVFEDANLKKRLSYADYQKITQRNSYDTIITFDPNTFQEIVQVVAVSLNPKEIEVFRVKQILHYNSKTKQLGLTPIAIAPLMSTYNAQKEITQQTPLFWMSINKVHTAMDLNPSTINWAKRLIRSISSDELTIIKGKKQLGDIIYDIVHSNGQNAEKAKFYHTFGNFTPLRPSEVSNIASSIDTIITFDPNTFERSVQVVKNKFDPQTVQTIRIIQNWVWNKETQKMNIRFVAFAPIIRRYDDAGNFLNSGPMFYKKPNE